MFFSALKSCIPSKRQGWKLNWDKADTDFYLGQGRRYDTPCHLKTEGGPWLVIQRRVNGAVSFYRSWAEYRSGFGSLKGDFWLGLDGIHYLSCLPNLKNLRIDIRDKHGTSGYATYSTFLVKDEESKYELKVNGYFGNITDELVHSNGHKFMTYDSLDTDSWSSGSCSEKYKAEWWYYHCFKENLNLKFGPLQTNLIGQGVDDRYMTWYTWNLTFEDIVLSEMKIQ